MNPQTKAEPRPIFVIRLQATRPTRSGSAIRGLRWILKSLGRAYGFRCIDITMDRGRR